MSSSPRVVASLLTVSALLVPGTSNGPATAAPKVPAAATVTGVLAAYTLVVPGSVAASHLQVRAVIPHGVPCPKVDVTNTKGTVTHLAMTKRVPAATTVSAFASLRACEANLPKSATKASVGGHKVPAALPATFDRIAMFGDTGCRVDDDLHQDCASPAQWPLAKNAKAIAKEKADVVIFTGDFYYREAICGRTKTNPDPANPVNRPVIDKCGGTPEPVPQSAFNDSDYGWMADVFIPLSPLFPKSPIVAVRGNHEMCSRGGNGWFLFFDASPLGTGACAPEANYGPVPGGKGAAKAEPVTPVWKFDMPLGGKRTLRAVIVDSAGGRNAEVTSWAATQRKSYEAADRKSAPTAGQESWLVTHRPMFGVDTTEEAVSAIPTWTQWTAIDQTAAGFGLIKNYDAMIGSHVHTAQVVQVPGQPAQFVIGNGGSIPDSADPATYPKPSVGPLFGSDGKPAAGVEKNAPWAQAGYQPASYYWNAIQYGYVVAKPGAKAHKWTMTQKKYDGTPFATCTLTGKKATCK